MEEDKPLTLSERLFEEFKAGNPLFIVLALFIVVLIGSLWVWRTVSSPLSTPTPRFSHPTAAAHIKTLTAQPPLQASATPAAAALVASTPAPTRQGGFFYNKKINQDWSDRPRLLHAFLR